MCAADNMEVRDFTGGILKSDPSMLIESVRESINKKIEEINYSADKDIKKIDDEIMEDIENFRAVQQKRLDELIAYEEGRMENLSSIEKKKRKLEVIESFIKKIIGASTFALRTDPRYPGFLKWCVLSALKNITGDRVTVSFSPSDMRFSEEIMKEITERGYKFRITVQSDDQIESGGVKVTDEQSEVVFNNTVERIVYRRMDEIKRIIVKELNEYTDGAALL